MNKIDKNKTRRDFLSTTSSFFSVFGAIGAAKSFVDSINPVSDLFCISTLDININNIASGKSMTVMWNEMPVFIRHRTKEEIEIAECFDKKALPYFELDNVRVQKKEWIVVIGFCDHLGCSPLGQKSKDNRGDYNGWVCPFYKSHYDTSGRIISGPATKNLNIPPYKFINDDTIRI